MNLSHQDVELYFKLMWAVQFYINQRFEVIPGIKSVDEYPLIGQEEKLQVREVLYKNIEVLDAFASENPAGLTPEEIDIVLSWKQFVSGRFYILKFLKKYTVFVSAELEEVYGVVGLYDSLKDVLAGAPLPFMVQAILLPFKEFIIYDGLLSSYSIYFGSGIKSSVNEAYQRAKQNNRIIDTLDPATIWEQRKEAPKTRGRSRPVLDDLVKNTNKLRQADTVIQTKAYGLLKASAKLAQLAAHDSNDLDQLYKLAKKTDRALNQFWTALDRAE